MRRIGPLVISLCVAPLVFAAPASAAEIELITDASGSMFAHGEIAPGYRSARCVQVAWKDNAAEAQLGISSAVTGDLAPYLQLQIEIGTGGGYASCAGFAGDMIYDGTLGGFGARYRSAETQLLGQRITSASGEVTFRITVMVMDVNEAQARTASADFTFSALDEGRLPAPPSPEPTTTRTPTPTDPAPTEPSPSAEPTSSPPPDDDEEPTSSPAPGDEEPTSSTAPGNQEPAAEPDDPAPAEVVSPGGNPPDPGTDAAYGDGAPSVTVPLTPRPEKKQSPLLAPVRAVVDAVRVVRDVVQESAAPVAKGVAWSAGTLPVLLLFLALQNKIDGRDPKLAQAPVFADPNLPFDDTYAPVSVSREVP